MKLFDLLDEREELEYKIKEEKKRIIKDALKKAGLKIGDIIALKDSPNKKAFLYDVYLQCYDLGKRKITLSVITRKIKKNGERSKMEDSRFYSVTLDSIVKV
jgi:hypothetical protein